MLWFVAAGLVLGGVAMQWMETDATDSYWMALTQFGLGGLGGSVGGFVLYLAVGLALETAGVDLGNF